MENFKPTKEDLTKVYFNGGTLQREVVCAANLHDNTGVIVCGVRNFDNIMHKQIQIMKSNPDEAYSVRGWEQGFVDQWGNFMDREEACIVAQASGQRLRNPSCERRLYSEDLY